MIREDELLDAIDECLGQKNPNANTCLKLASYFTILDNLYGRDDGYSYAAEPVSQPKTRLGDSEFARILENRSLADVFPVLDELMDTIRVLHPRMYDAVLREMRG